MAAATPETLGLSWQKREIPATSYRAKQNIPGDPLYDWLLCDRDGEGLVVVKWDERHGWDAYSLITGGYLAGKWDGPDMAYEGEDLSKLAAERHAVARLAGG